MAATPRNACEPLCTYIDRTINQRAVHARLVPATTALMTMVTEKYLGA